VAYLADQATTWTASPVTHVLWELVTLGGLLSQADLLSLLTLSAVWLIWKIHQDSGNLD
jgi:hypothetical protein